MSFYIQLFVLLLNLFHDFVGNLVSNILDMGPTFSCTDGVYKADLLELAVTHTADNFPSVRLQLYNFWQFFVFFCIQVQITVIFKVFNFKQLPIEFYLDAWVSHACHIISSLRKQ